MSDSQDTNGNGIKRFVSKGAPWAVALLMLLTNFAMPYVQSRQDEAVTTSKIWGKIGEHERRIGNVEDEVDSLNAETNENYNEIIQRLSRLETLMRDQRDRDVNGPLSDSPIRPDEPDPS